MADDARDEYVTALAEVWQEPFEAARIRRVRALRACVDEHWATETDRPSNEEIKRRVAILAALDPQCRAFGANKHRYQLRPVLAGAELEALEARLGCTLPAQYRRFVSEIGDGGAGPFYGIHPVAATRATELGIPFERPVAVPLELDEDEEPGVWWKWTDAGLLFLCDVGCGAGFWLVCAGKDRGHVWSQGDSTDLVPELIDGTTYERGTEELLATDRERHVEFLDWYVRWLEDALLALAK